MAREIKTVVLRVHTETWSGTCHVPGRQRKSLTTFRSKKRIPNAVRRSIRKAA